MFLKHKRDTEQYLRENTVSSMQQNKYIEEGDFISTPYFSYVAVREETDIPLQNDLFAKLVPSPYADKNELIINNSRPVINSVGGISTGTNFDNSNIKNILEDIFYKEISKDIQEVYVGTTTSDILTSEDLNSLTKIDGPKLPLKFSMELNDNKLAVLISNKLSNGYLVLIEDVMMRQISEEIKSFFNLNDSYISIKNIFDISNVTIDSKDYIKLITKNIIHSGNYEFSIQVTDNTTNIINYLVEEINILKKEINNLKGDKR